MIIITFPQGFGGAADFSTVFFGHKKGRQIALAAFVDYEISKPWCFPQP
jgi:hypothetical protein